MREGEVAGAPSRGAYPTTHSCACLSAHRTYGLCGLAQVSARTALRARFAVSRSAAARRVPLDLRTHSVRQIRRDTSASWTRVAAQLKPMKRHCFAHRAKQAEPPPTHNRSVWRYAVHRRVPRPDRAVETCGGTSCTAACGDTPCTGVGRGRIVRSRRVAVRHATAACGDTPCTGAGRGRIVRSRRVAVRHATAACGDTLCTGAGRGRIVRSRRVVVRHAAEACDAATMRRGELRRARWRGGGVATRAGSPSYARWGRCEA